MFSSARRWALRVATVVALTVMGGTPAVAGAQDAARADSVGDAAPATAMATDSSAVAVAIGSSRCSAPDAGELDVRLDGSASTVQQLVDVDVDGARRVDRHAVLPGEAGALVVPLGADGSHTVQVYAEHGPDHLVVLTEAEVVTRCAMPGASTEPVQVSPDGRPGPADAPSTPEDGATPSADGSPTVAESEPRETTAPTEGVSHGSTGSSLGSPDPVDLPGVSLSVYAVHRVCGPAGPSVKVRAFNDGDTAVWAVILGDGDGPLTDRVEIGPSTHYIVELPLHDPGPTPLRVVAYPGPSTDAATEVAATTLDVTCGQAPPVDGTVEVVGCTADGGSVLRATLDARRSQAATHMSIHIDDQDVPSGTVEPHGTGVIEWSVPPGKQEYVVDVMAGSGFLQDVWRVARETLVTGCGGPPVFAPSGSLQAPACAATLPSRLVYVLDNSRSTVRADYDLATDGDARSVTVPASSRVSAAIELARETGVVTLRARRTDGSDGVPIAGTTTAACAAPSQVGAVMPARAAGARVLAATGSQLGVLGALALGLVGMGAGLLAAARRTTTAGAAAR